MKSSSQFTSEKLCEPLEKSGPESERDHSQVILLQDCKIDDPPPHTSIDVDSILKERTLKLFGFEVRPAYCGETQGRDDAMRSTSEEKIEGERKLEAGGAEVLTGQDSQATGSLNEEDRKYECHFCSREFGSSQALGGHQNSHKRERLQAKRAHILANRSSANMIRYGGISYSKHHHRHHHHGGISTRVAPHSALVTPLTQVHRLPFLIGNVNSLGYQHTNTSSMAVERPVAFRPAIFGHLPQSVSESTSTGWPGTSCSSHFSLGQLKYGKSSAAFSTISAGVQRPLELVSSLQAMQTQPDQIAGESIKSSSDRYDLDLNLELGPPH